MVDMKRKTKVKTYYWMKTLFMGIIFAFVVFSVGNFDVTKLTTNILLKDILIVMSAFFAFYFLEKSSDYLRR